MTEEKIPRREETGEMSEVQSEPEIRSEPEVQTEKKKGRFKAWWEKHKPTKRRLIQVYVALLTNANIRGFAVGDIYKGATKNFCVPGLNCYSCPGAVGSCPLGALQDAFAATNARAPYYVFGILLLLGLIFARTVCGWLCPVGLGQELLYKIRTPKLKKSRITRVLSYFKYILLAVFVVAIPLLLAGTPTPAFCKFVCPAGTFGGAIWLLAHPANAGKFAGLGALFTWKFALLVAIVVASVFIFRFFCRFFCPLGAIYGFFNKIALLGVKLDKNKCTDCGLCVSHCKMDIRKVGDHECINCGECIGVCPAKAISWKGSKIFLHKNAVAPAPETEEGIKRGDGVEFSLAANLSVSVTEPVAEAASVPVAEVLPKEKRPRRGKAFWLRVAAWSAALCVLCGALVYYNFIDAAPAEDSVGNQVGETCFDFTLSSYNGEDFTLSEHRGKVVLINFWGITCGPCIEELPFIEELRAEYADTVEVVAVHQEAFFPDEVVSFLEERGWMSWGTNFVQDKEEDETFVKLGGRSSWPYNVLVDGEGVIRYKLDGKLTEEILRTEIENILRPASEETAA